MVRSGGRRFGPRLGRRRRCRHTRRIQLVRVLFIAVACVVRGRVDAVRVTVIVEKRQVDTI